MNNAILIYNEEEGIKAGGSNFINEGGPYVATITAAKYVKASTGTDGIEFSIETQDGLKCNYLTVYHRKGNNESIPGGSAALNAMMGLLGINQLTSKQIEKHHTCPELEGKTIGLFLQKVHYTKNDNKGDGYKFEIRVPFSAQSSQTLKEIANKEQPKTIENMSKSYKDKDERKAIQQAPSSDQYAPTMNGFYGDVPGFD